MRHKFLNLKNGKIYTFKTTLDKVLTSIIIDGHFVINPSLEQFLADGWELVYESEPEDAEIVEPLEADEAEVVETEETEDVETVEENIEEKLDEE